MEKAKRAICDARRAGKTKDAAARAAGVARMTLHRWLREDAFFAAAFVEAEKEYRLGRAA